MSDEPVPLGHPGPMRVEALALTLQLVGGLLLGAALVSLSIFFAPEHLAQPVAALAVAAAALVGARLAERRDRGASEAMLAAGLVVAASIPFYAHSPPALGALGAGLALGATLLRAGRSPLALAAALAFALDLHHASGVDLFAAHHGPGVWVLYGGMLGYGALLLHQRGAPWSGAALALHAPLLTLALLPVLDRAGVRDPGLAALAVGAQLALVLALAVRMGARPLVGTACALLGLAALTFAFMSLGPALSAMILLLMGALLVWRAEALRVYFARA